MKELPKRIIFGVLFAAIVVVGTVILPPLFHLLMAFAIAWTLHEFYVMSMGEKDFLSERVMAALAPELFYGLLVLYKSGHLVNPAYLAISILPILALIVAPIWRKDHSNHGKLAYIFAGLGYIGLPMSLTPILMYHDGTQDGWLILSLLLMVWGADVGAYFIGTAFGQRPNSIKIAPAISPKKSLWGLFGAVLFGIGIAVGLHYLGLVKLPLGASVAVGGLAAAGGLLGDLVESMWKRYFGVKDSGNLIPGHGGLYDRLDSAILALPVITVYLAVTGLL